MNDNDADVYNRNSVKYMDIDVKLVRIQDKIRSLHNFNPITFVIMGGGFSIADLMKYPGSTSVVRNLLCPQDEHSMNAFYYMDPLVNDYPDGVKYGCNADYTRVVAEKFFFHFGTPVVVVNCALNTTRPRKGNDRLFIALVHKPDEDTETVSVSLEEDLGKNFINIPNVNEQVRLMQDRYAAFKALELIINQLEEQEES